MWTLTTANGPWGTKVQTQHATKEEALAALDALCMEAEVDDAGDEVFAYRDSDRALCAHIEQDDDSIMGLMAGLGRMVRGVK